jgi:hypothetical protein
MHHHHPIHLLTVANVCHPDVDARNRRDVLWNVAMEGGLASWERRLRNRTAANPMLAMRMLTVLENQYRALEPWDDHVPEPTGKLHLGVLFAGLALFLWAGIVWADSKKK